MSPKQLRSIADCGRMTKRDLVIEAIGDDSGIDYALPQDWLNQSAHELRGRYSYEIIRVSLVTDYRDVKRLGSFLPITAEGIEILKLLGIYLPCNN